MHIKGGAQMWWSPAPMVKMSPMAGGLIPRTPPRMKCPFSECYVYMPGVLESHLQQPWWNLNHSHILQQPLEEGAWVMHVSSRSLYVA